MPQMPVPGDIVVTRRTHSPPVYLIGLYLEAEAVIYSRRNEAIDEAMAYASEAKVDAWVVEAGQFSVISRHRRS